MPDRERARTIAVAEIGLVSAGARQRADRALLATAGGRGPVLHVYRYRPAVLVGRHQWPDREARADWCRANGVAIVRRPTGGGAIYVDEGQVAFSLALPRRAVAGDPGLAGILTRGAEALRSGLACLGVAAAVKPPNDVEAGGRKLASVFAALTETGVLVQGTVLLDVHIDRVLMALRVPTEKLSADGLAGARRRLATVGELLGRAPDRIAVTRAVADGLAAAYGFSPVPAGGPGDAADTGPGPSAESGAAGPPPHPTPTCEAAWPCGGVLRARIWLDAGGGTVARASLAADGFVAPADLLDRLAGALSGAPLSAIRARVARFFADEPADLVGFGPADVARVLALAADRPAQARAFSLAPREANALMVVGPEGLAPAEIARLATVMLVPYCAKLVRCKWRRRDGCTACGLCEVGDAYRIGRARGMRVISIHDYEHLTATLERLKAERVPAYVGMCCGQFYLKRHRAFRDAGIPALLMNIAGANCYELLAEEQAYAGAFAAKSTLDIGLLEKVLGIDPEPAPPRRAQLARDVGRDM